MLRHRAAVLYTVLIAVAYCLTGKLGLMLAVHPGFATAVFPPAGIALAAALGFGNVALIGVWCGSTALNSWAGAPPLVAAIIGVGATLQAFASARLIRVKIGAETPLVRESDLFKFLLLGGPAGCLVNATWSLSMLFAFHVVPLDHVLFNWMTWWLGDSLGVLVFTPMLLCWIGKPRDIWAARRRTLPFALGGAFLVAVVFFLRTSSTQQALVADEFDNVTDRMAASIQEQVQNAGSMLIAMEAAASAFGTPTAEEYDALTAKMLTMHPDLQAVAWNLRVPAAARASVETDLRRRGWVQGIVERQPDGELVRAPSRAEYFPVMYIYPVDGTRPPFGFDIMSDGVRRAAAERARDTGKLALTGAVVLMKETPGQLGWLMLYPKYRGADPPQSVEERRARLEGFFICALRVKDMVAAALQFIGPDLPLVRLTDVTDANGRVLHADTEFLAPPALPRRSLPMSIGGRTYALDFQQRGGPPERLEPLTSYAITVSALLFTGLLGAFLLVVTGRNVIVEGEVKERTAALERLNDALQLQTVELARSNRDLAQFSYVVSHDLKEPLRKVSSYTRLLADDPKTEAGSRYFNYIIDGATRMQSLIDDLLALAQIGGDYSQRKARVSLDLALDSALNNMEVRMRDSGATLTRGPLPEVFGISARLVAVFQNLVDNALKYHGATPPRVHVACVRSGAYWRITIHDSGIGIDPRDHQEIFVLFRRLHNRTDYPGTGIGLAICERIVEQHGGKIGVESSLGAGATFWFTLPVNTDS